MLLHKAAEASLHSVTVSAGISSVQDVKGLNYRSCWHHPLVLVLVLARSMQNARVAGSGRVRDGLEARQWAPD